MGNISFLKTPPLISLSGNPVNFRLAGRFAFAGDMSKFHGVFTVDPTIYDYSNHIRFKWGTKSVTFTLIGSGTDGGEDLLSFPFTIDLQDLYTFFCKSADLFEDFIITKYSNSISLDARKAGSEYNMTMDSDHIFYGTEGNYHLQFAWEASNVSDSTPSYYRIGLKIPVENEFLSVDYPPRRPDQDEVLPDGFDSAKAGIADIDVRDFYKKDLSGHYTFPEPDSGFSFKKDILTQGSVYAFQKVGLPPVDSAGINSDPFYVLQGRLSAFSQGELNYLGKNFTDKLAESGMFLTNAPIEKVTDIYAPERLYFLFRTTGTFKLYVKEYYSDGTINNQLRESMTIDSVQVREILCSYKRIRTNSPKVVTRYDVYITNSADAAYSEVRTFILDYSFQPFARYFLFMNQFGVYELVRTTGKVKKVKNIKKNFVSVPLPADFSETDREEKQISADVETAYSVSSGFLADKYQSDWFQELLMSKDVYWLKKGKAFPVLIQESKNEVQNDADFNFSQEFTLTHAIHDDFTEEFTTDSPIIIGDFNLDFSTDFFLGDATEPPVGETVFSSPFTLWTQNSTWNMVLPSDFNWLVMGGSASGVKGSVVNENNQARITTGTAGSPSWNMINFQPKVALSAGSYVITFDLLEMDPLANFKVLTNDGEVFKTKQAGSFEVFFNISVEGFNLTLIADDTAARSCLLDNVVIKKLS